jgi:hypothetical protein
MRGYYENRKTYKLEIHPDRNAHGGSCNNDLDYNAYAYVKRCQAKSKIRALVRIQ